jgi:ribosomal protein S18 acetylase RimI-like enzyme
VSVESATIRAATVDDADAIAAVHDRAWQVAYRDILPEVARQGYPLERQQAIWRRNLEDTAPELRVWVVEQAERVIGFVAIGSSRDDGASGGSTATGSGTGELYSIYLEPAQIGTGVGLMLMEHATQHLRSRFQRATLWTFRENEHARRFYERAGWTADGSEQAIEIGDFEAVEVRYAIEFDD